MKNFILLVILAMCCNFSSAQTKVFDFNDFAQSSAQLAGTTTGQLVNLQVLDFNGRIFVKARFQNPGGSVTVGQEYQKGGPGADGDWIPIGLTITCTGVKCSECDLEGLPNPENVWCNCVRRVDDTGYCNMTKSTSVGK